MPPTPPTAILTRMNNVRERTPGKLAGSTWVNELVRQQLNPFPQISGHSNGESKLQHPFVTVEQTSVGGDGFPVYTIRDILTDEELATGVSLVGNGARNIPGTTVVTDSASIGAGYWNDLTVFVLVWADEQLVCE